MSDREIIVKLVKLYQKSQQSFSTNHEALDVLYGALNDASIYLASPRPTVVCLCGSTRFYHNFQEANYRETMAGRIVLSVGFYPHSSEIAHGEKVGCDDAQKLALDQLHMRKIDLADEILVLNVLGYIGDSTRREIAYAEHKGKVIRYLEPPCSVT